MERNEEMLHTLLDDIDTRLQRGEKVDVDALALQYPAFAGEIRDHVAASALTAVPELPTWAPPPAEEVDARRKASWMRFLEVTSSEPLPVASLWNRLVRAIPEVLEDLAAFSVLRGARPVYQRASTLTAGGTKGVTIATQPPPGPIDLKPLRSGDRVMITLLMPRQGVPVVLTSEEGRVTLLHPARADQAGEVEAGTRVSVSGQVRGQPGETQELACMVLPGSLARTLPGRSEEELIDVLLQQQDTALRRYRFRIDG